LEVMMKVAVLESVSVFLVAFCTAEDGPPQDDYYPGPTLQEVKDLIDAVEATKNELLADLSRATTIQGIVEHRRTSVENEFLVRLALSNEQQDERTDSYAAQLKDLQHRRDAMVVIVEETNVLAEYVESSWEEQNEFYLDGDIKEADDGQQMDIDQLAENVPAFKDLILENGKGLVEIFLRGFYDDVVVGRIANLTEIVNSRKCEYGSGTFDVGQHDVVFATTFKEIPSVALEVTGFVAHLDQHSYDGYDKASLLAFDKFADYVNVNGFGVTVNDNSETKVAIKSISCSWMACSPEVLTFESRDKGPETPEV